MISDIRAPRRQRAARSRSPVETGNGTAPFILTWLISVTGNTAVAPGLYMTMLALLSTVAVLRCRESAGRPLPD